MPAPQNAAIDADPRPLHDSAAPSEVEERDTESFPVLVEADLLVEDVSIDGMCGVY